LELTQEDEAALSRSIYLRLDKFMKWKDLLPAMSVAVLCACFSAAAAHSAEMKKDKAPAFSFRSFDGKEIKLSQFRGKPILLKFIASW
jgi:hypothetical protein